MESDIVRASGDDTVVDLWIEGRSRAVTVPRRAVEWYLRSPDFDTTSLTKTECSEFVRNHLRVISKAAAEQLSANPWLDTIVIRPGELRS